MTFGPGARLVHDRVSVEDALLGERVAKPLRDAADHLRVDHRRVDDPPGVVRGEAVHEDDGQRDVEAAGEAGQDRPLS